MEAELRVLRPFAHLPLSVLPMEAGLDVQVGPSHTLPGLSKAIVVAHLFITSDL